MTKYRRQSEAVEQIELYKGLTDIAAVLSDLLYNHHRDLGASYHPFGDLTVSPSDVIDAFSQCDGILGDIPQPQGLLHLELNNLLIVVCLLNRRYL